LTKTALIVEDEAPIGDLMAQILRLRGFEPTVLREGRPTVEWVREHRPDVVLLDLMLPDRSGFEICEALKLDRETNLIPVIMVTAMDRHKDVVQGLKVGANYYLTKPFTIEHLYEAIDQVLAWREEIGKEGLEGEIHFQLQSDTQYLEELNQLLSSLFLHTGLSEEQIRQFTYAVRELGVNAIEWGHRKQVERLVTVTYRIESKKIVIVIKDTGPGFDPKNLPHAAKDEDPASHVEVRQAMGMRSGGFGIMLAKGLVDEMKYNETGNEVRLVKYLPG